MRYCEPMHGQRQGAKEMKCTGRPYDPGCNRVTRGCGGNEQLWALDGQHTITWLPIWRPRRIVTGVVNSK